LEKITSNKISKNKNNVLGNVLNEVGYLKCTLLICFNKWGDLVVNELILIFEIQGSIATNDIGCVQHWNVDKIFTTFVTNLG
jgi:hypothetical protein